MHKYHKNMYDKEIIIIVIIIITNNNMNNTHSPIIVLQLL